MQINLLTTHSPLSPNSPLSLSHKIRRSDQEDSREERKRGRGERNRDRDAAAQVKADHAVPPAAAANVRGHGDRTGGAAGGPRGAVRPCPRLLLRGLQVPQGSPFVVSFFGIKIELLVISAKIGQISVLISGYSLLGRSLLSFGDSNYF